MEWIGSHRQLSWPRRARPHWRHLGDMRLLCRGDTWHQPATVLPRPANPGPKVKFVITGTGTSKATDHKQSNNNCWIFVVVVLLKTLFTNITVLPRCKMYTCETSYTHLYSKHYDVGCLKKAFGMLMQNISLENQLIPCISQTRPGDHAIFFLQWR